MVSHWRYLGSVDAWNTWILKTSLWLQFGVGDKQRKTGRQGMCLKSYNGGCCDLAIPRFDESGIVSLYMCF